MKIKLDKKCKQCDERDRGKIVDAIVSPIEVEAPRREALYFGRDGKLYILSGDYDIVKEKTTRVKLRYM